MKLLYRVIFILIIVFIFCIVYNLLRIKDLQNKRFSHGPIKDYNIVLIFIDTLRADHLGCYGYFRKTSPNIDKLSKESFVFEQNFATASYTLASTMSIITSLYPKSHSCFEIYKDRLSPRVKTLAQVLQIYGYETAWFGPKHGRHLDPEVGFGFGFNNVDLFDARVLDKLRKKICDWLNKNKNKKFFLNFHTYKVHDPYFPSFKYKQKFTINKLRNGIIEDEEQYGILCRKFIVQEKEKTREIIGKELFSELVASGILNGDDRSGIFSFFDSMRAGDKLGRVREYVYWKGTNLDEPLVNAHMQALYDADILEFDEEIIAPLIRELKVLNLYDKTIIVICADHGEEFYEHKGHGHGGTFFDELIHVPLIIRVPWIKHGKRVKELTQTVDIMPTLLDLIGVPIPHQTQGKSLDSFIYGRKLPPFHDYVFGQMTWISYIRSKEWKLFLEENGMRNLYHIANDPKEQKNVYFENQDIALSMELAFKRWEASLPSYKDQEYSYPLEIDEAAQERIRKTGYW